MPARVSDDTPSEHRAVAIGLHRYLFLVRPTQKPGARLGCQALQGEQELLASLLGPMSCDFGFSGHLIVC